MEIIKLKLTNILNSFDTALLIAQYSIDIVLTLGFGHDITILKEEFFVKLIISIIN